MGIQDTRIRNLKALTEAKFGGNTAALCRAVDENPSYIARIYSGERPFTEDRARSIEEKAGLLPPIEPRS